MKPSTHPSSSGSHWVIWLSFAAFLILAASHARARDLRLTFSATWNDSPIQMNHWIPNAAPAGRSVSAAKFLISRPAVQHPDGTWQVIRETFACIDLASEEGKSVTLTGLHDTPISGIRFDVGVPPTENAALLADLPQTHPLNPTTCPLKLTAQPGYTFLSLSGLWRQEDGQLGEFLYELKGDPYLARVELPLPEASSDAPLLHIAFDAASAVSDFDPKHLSTVESHPALTTLSFNVRKAFRVITGASSNRPTTFEITQN